jgi:hypothetical protein
MKPSKDLSLSPRPMRRKLMMLIQTAKSKLCNQNWNVRFLVLANSMSKHIWL